ncbi:hypothetical protein IV500_06035 [Paeniglutamicibacter antarcticus]|uniref:Uncharacterized protein n=1 Tax=Arthrobacter terrae TaxID=2935737 RepID=A0A931CI20_9MICC|nr:hypothetical protein [Arthrobacter terrae]
MAAAIDRRLVSSWADNPNELVEGLRDAYPEELVAARTLVKAHLGSQRQWRLKAQSVRDRQLAGLMDRRRTSGSTRGILALRFVLMAALIALPVSIAATDRENLLKLVLAGVACFILAVVGGHIITVQARVPVMPAIRGAWLSELREDVVNATLVAILRSKGILMEARTIAAAERGIESIRSASQAVATLRD